MHFSKVKAPLRPNISSKATHSKKPQTIDLSISIDSLKDNKGYTAIYPRAPQTGKTIKRENAKIDKAKATGSYKFPKFNYESNAWVEYADDMAIAQANKVEYKGRPYPYLFYEAAVKFRSRVRFFENDSIYFVRNENAFNVYDLNIASIKGFYYLAVLKPGKYKISFKKQKYGPGINLRKLGFFPKEEAAFKSVWQGKFFDVGLDATCNVDDIGRQAEAKKIGR